MSVPAILRRDDLAEFFASNPRLLSAFEDQSLAVVEGAAAAVSSAAATEAMKDATVIVLSANGDFTNERVLRLEEGLELDDSDPAFVTIRLGAVARTTDYAVTFVPPGDATLFLPLAGTLASEEQPFFPSLPNYANDAAAAAGGLAIGRLYRNGSIVMVRVT